MTKKLAALVSWVCTAWLVLLPLGMLYLLINISTLASLAASNLALPIQWHTVDNGQWYALWTITVAYVGIGLAAVWYLRKAFSSFARGNWFDGDNSVWLRRFAALLMLQGVARPVHLALSSLILSFNHPPGERTLSITAGSNELGLIVAGLIMWVLADLLVKGTQADAENRQFV